MKMTGIRFAMVVMIAIMFISTAFIPALADIAQFTDTGSHWARDYIGLLTENGAIKGYTDGTFRPDNRMTRAEFTAILLRATNNDAGQPEEGKWYANYIAEAANRKYILAGEFDNVDQNITRGEIARMIVRTMSEEYPANIEEYTSQLADYSNTPTAYKEFVLKAYVKGIITGRPGKKFDYAALATRAEATAMIVRLIDASQRIIPEEPESYDVYVKDPLYGKPTKVTSSHPELLPRIKFILDLLSKEGYTNAIYSQEANVVQILWYKDKSDFDVPLESRRCTLRIDISTEQNPRKDYYLAYSVGIADLNNATAQNLFKTVIKEIFAEAYDKIAKELDNKTRDINYRGRIWEKIEGRELRVFTFSGVSQIDVYCELENK